MQTVTTAEDVVDKADKADQDSLKLPTSKILCRPVSYTHLTLPTNREV